MINKFNGLDLRRLVAFTSMILTMVLLFGLAGQAAAAITLISFTATGMDSNVLVEWETATELDNLGFFVQASNQEAGSYTRISNFILSQGDGLTGSSYSYTDNNVTLGVRKYYKLESIANDQSSELTGPVSAVPGQQLTSTSTLTPTSTSTLTPVPTETSIDSSAYPEPPTPTSPYPGIATTAPPVSVPTTAAPIQLSTSTPGGFPSQPSPSPAAISTDQGLGFPVPAGTLIPLPSITIQFPEDSTATPELNLQANLGMPKEDGESGSSANLSRYVTLGFIVLIWALLGGWFWFSFRKVE